MDRPRRNVGRPARFLNGVEDSFKRSRSKRNPGQEVDTATSQFDQLNLGEEVAGNGLTSQSGLEVLPSEPKLTLPKRSRRKRDADQKVATQQLLEVTTTPKEDLAILQSDPGTFPAPDSNQLPPPPEFESLPSTFEFPLLPPPPGFHCNDDEPAPLFAAEQTSPFADDHRSFSLTDDPTAFPTFEDEAAFPFQDEHPAHLDENAPPADEDRSPARFVRTGAAILALPEDEVGPMQLNYEIVLGGTINGFPALMDGLGYAYSLRNHSGKSKWHWACTHRDGKGGREGCRAVVHQRVIFKSSETPEVAADVTDPPSEEPLDKKSELALKRKRNLEALERKINRLQSYCNDDFDFEAHSQEEKHSHHPDPDTGDKRKVARDIKAKAAQEKFESAGAVFDDFMAGAEDISSLPDRDHMVRRINRAREKQFPKVDITGTGYTINFDAVEGGSNLTHIPVVVRCGGRDVQHDIFFMPDQRAIAKRCETLFADATYKLAPKGAMQVFTINGFVQRVSGDTEIMQVPLVFVIMKSRRFKDYEAVLKAIWMEFRSSALVEVVCDFERALWKAIREVFQVEVRGCNFHWKQAVLRKAANHQMAIDYRATGSPIRKTLMQVMCLPYLPPMKITNTFQTIRASAPEEKRLQDFLDYVEATWIRSATMGPETWSVFDIAIRTNNDCEGLHNRWNLRARSRKGFYWILNLISTECSLVTKRVGHFNRGLLKRSRREKAKSVDAELFKSWKTYTDESKSEAWLLEKVQTIVYHQFPKIGSLNDQQPFPDVNDIIDDIDRFACEEEEL